MIISIFAATVKLIAKRTIQCARSVSYKRAFFMPLGLILGLNYNFLTAASSLNGTPEYPHLIFSLCDDFTVGGKGGSRFLLHPTNSKIIMQKSTPEPIVVLVTPAQQKVLHFLNHSQAKSIGACLFAVTQSAFDADCPDVESLSKTMELTKIIYELALELHEQVELIEAIDRGA